MGMVEIAEEVESPKSATSRIDREFESILLLINPFNKEKKI